MVTFDVWRLSRKKIRERVRNGWIYSTIGGPQTLCVGGGNMNPAPSLDWCRGVSIAAAVVAAVCMSLPAPKITSTLRSNPAEFCYRVIALPLLLWYDTFGSLTIIVGSFITDDEDWSGQSSDVYAVNAGVAAAVVLVVVAFVLLHDTCLWRCCCCCCPTPSLAGDGWVSSIARWAARRKGETVYAQKKVISMGVSAIITALITPQLAPYTGTTAVGVFVMVVIGLVVALFGVIIGDCIADAVVYVQFSIMAAAALIFAVFYAVKGDWAHRGSSVYATALCMLVGFTVIHLSYDFIVRRYFHRCWCFGELRGDKLAVQQDEDADAEENQAFTFDLAKMPKTQDAGARADN